jgi:site-specific DNA recombinase
LQESIDTSTPAGRLFYTMIAAMAQWEREEIADRVAASVPVRAKMGKSLGGQAPFGYAWNGHDLVPHPTEAPIRKLIYELFLEHRRKRTVASMLNEQGYRTRNGSPFSDTTVDRLLRDPTAKGQRRANYTKSTGEGKKWIKKPKEEWVLLPVEPIVSSELWDQCNYILDEQRERLKRPARKPTHLFTGFVFCEQCGQKMYVPSNTPKYVCRSCRNKIGVTDMEEIFHSQLQGFLSAPAEILGYLNEADRIIHEKEALLAALSDEHRRLTQEADKVYRAFIDDDIDSKTFGSRHKPIEERLSQIEAQLPDLQGEIDFLKIQYLSQDQVINEARDLSSHWPEFLPDEKRRIVESITDRIVVGKDDIAIQLAYLPSNIPPSVEMMATMQRNPRDSSRRRG